MDSTTEQPGKPGKRKLVMKVVTTLVTLAVCAGLVWKVEPGPLWRSASGIGLWSLLGICAFSLFFDTVNAAELFRRGLELFGQRLSFATSLVATSGSLTMRAVMPVGTGHLARAIYINRTEGTPLSATVAATVSLVWFKLLWLTAVPLYGLLVVYHLWWHAAVLGAGLTAGLVATAFCPTIFRMVGPRLPNKLQVMSQGFDDVRPSALPLVALHAGLSSTAAVVVFGMLLHALGGEVDPLALATYYPLCLISGKLPITLAGIGTRDATAQLLLGNSVDRAVLLAATLMFSAVAQLLPGVLGALFTWPFVSRMVKSREPAQQ